MLRSDILRSKFSQALSDLYKREVSLYNDLIDIVQEINAGSNSNLDDSGGRLKIERHGAIRLGTVKELRIIRRIFRLMGMFPVGYYDLSSTGIPLHATAFRPITTEALAVNPFRVFTTLLRVDMLGAHIKELVETILSKRRIFSARLLELVEILETTSDYVKEYEDEFITEALQSFTFQHLATVSYDTYEMLKQEHPILVDVVAFSTVHINHLTPRTLDIDAVQCRIMSRGIAAKNRVEGPPLRRCPVLLRQTSFKAVEEEIYFSDTHAISAHSTTRTAAHRVRFGEVEQRGIALTQKGQQLYDRLLAKALGETLPEHGAKSYNEVLQRTFEEFPDDWETLRRRDLAYFRYSVAHVPQNPLSALIDLDELVALGILHVAPIIYEDFLPISAAGIFESNLDLTTQRNHQARGANADKEGFCRALGVEVQDYFELYAKMRAKSVKDCLEALQQ
ncbi:hypothetical protein F5884DRAFT_806170 [Xylogone sp. PMI_703]|nr:hypothetical protein F5884DRAFT_806170 [Xylogone sp. PMI_703]